MIKEWEHYYYSKMLISKKISKNKDNKYLVCTK